MNIHRTIWLGHWHLPPFNLCVRIFIAYQIEPLFVNSISFAFVWVFLIFLCDASLFGHVFRECLSDTIRPPLGEKVKCLYVYHQPSLCPSVRSNYCPLFVNIYVFVSVLEIFSTFLCIQTALKPTSKKQTQLSVFIAVHIRKRIKTNLGFTETVR